MVTLPGMEPLKKTIKDKEERDALVAVVEEAIAKPTKANIAKVEKAFTAKAVETKKAVEKEQIKEKAVSKKLKKEEKKAEKEKVSEVVKTVEEIVGAKGVSEQKLKELEAENEKLKQQLADKIPKETTSTPRPYSGEASRRW